MSLCFLKSQKAGNRYYYSVNTWIKGVNSFHTVCAVRQWSPTFLAPGTSFTEDSVFHGGRRGGRIGPGGFEHVVICCALHLFVPCAAFSSCAQCGLLFTGAGGLLAAVASFVAEHRL